MRIPKVVLLPHNHVMSNFFQSPRLRNPNAQAISPLESILACESGDITRSSSRGQLLLHRPKPTYRGHLSLQWVIPHII